MSVIHDYGPGTPRTDPKGLTSLRRLPSLAASVFRDEMGNRVAADLQD